MVAARRWVRWSVLLVLASWCDALNVGHASQRTIDDDANDAIDANGEVGWRGSSAPHEFTAVTNIDTGADGLFEVVVGRRSNFFPRFLGSPDVVTSSIQVGAQHQESPQEKARQLQIDGDEEEEEEDEEEVDEEGEVNEEEEEEEEEEEDEEEEDEEEEEEEIGEEEEEEAEEKQGTEIDELTDRDQKAEFAMPPGSFFLPAVNHVNPEKYYSETEQSIYIPVVGQQVHDHQFRPQTRVVLVKNKPNEQIDSLTPIRGSSGPLDLVMTVYPHLPELLPQPHDSSAHSVVHEVRMVTPAHGYLPTNLKPASPRGNGPISSQPINVQPQGFNDQHLSGSTSKAHSIRYHSFTQQDISPLNFIRPSARNPHITKVQSTSSIAGFNSGLNPGFNSDQRTHSLLKFIKPSSRDTFITSAQNPNSGFNSGQQAYKPLNFIRPSARDPHISNVQNSSSGSDSEFVFSREVHSSLNFIHSSAQGPHNDSGKDSNSVSDAGFVPSRQMHSSIQVVPQDFESNLSTFRSQGQLQQQHPNGEDTKVVPAINVTQQQRQILMIPGNSGEIVVRTKMATFPDFAADSSDPSFDGIEIITKDPNDEGVLFVIGNRTDFKSSVQPFQLSPTGTNESFNSVQGQIQVSQIPEQTESDFTQNDFKETNQLLQSNSSGGNESSSSVRPKTQIQIPENSEIHQKSVDGSPPQATAAESHADSKTTAGHIPHFILVDATKNTTQIPSQPPSDEPGKISETYTEKAEEKGDKQEEEKEEVKDLDETESMVKPFYKFRTISPKGAVYTVKQGHSKVKFFGFNALHGPFKRVPEVTTEKKSLADWTVNAPESRKLPIKKSVTITLKRKTVRPVYFHTKPQDVTT